MATTSPRRSWSRKWLAALAAGAGICVAFGPTIASAAIPNSSTAMVNACYATSGGALRVIDTQAGQACRSGEQPLNWPASASRATAYSTTQSVNLPHDGGLYATVLTGPVLPAGTWNVSMHAVIINGTGQADTFRCGVNNGAGGLLAGDATTVTGPGYESVTVPALVTFANADRVNVLCLHDASLPAGLLQLYFATVVAEQVATRF